MNEQLSPVSRTGWMCGLRGKVERVNKKSDTGRTLPSGHGF